MTTVTIPKNLIDRGVLVLVDKITFDGLRKENEELRLALKAVADGELVLRSQKTRPFRDFLRDEFPEYAKDF